MRIVVVLVVVVLVVILGAALFMYSGVYNVAAVEPHNPLVAWALNTTTVRSIKHHADQGIAVPALTDEARIREGAEHFDEMCVTCHGAPGIERAEIGKGLMPSPPDLPKAAAFWNPPELFWILKHGIRMTGMPALGPTHSDEQIWAIVAFVEKLPGMSPDDYQRWVGAEGEGGHKHGPHG